MLREKPVVWLGAAGTGAAFGLARTLREHWGSSVTIIAADTGEQRLVAASVLADKFLTVPKTADPQFQNFLLAALREHSVTHYHPILDEEVLSAASARDANLLCGINVSAPSAFGALCAVDKLAGADWMFGHGIPSPPTTPLKEAQWHGKPLFAKPRQGRGSIGARAIESEAAFNSLPQDEDLIIQNLCHSPEITVDAVHLNGTTRAVARERLEIKAGVCTKARVFESEELEELANKIATGLGLEHAFCFQVMRYEETWAVTDINPRPGAGTRLSVSAGVDLLGAMFAYHFGEPFKHLIPRLKEEKFVVRQYSEYVTQ